MAEANSKDDVVPGRMSDNMKYENLALEGGGAKGLAYLGVLKVCLYKPHTLYCAFFVCAHYKKMICKLYLTH